MTWIAIALAIVQAGSGNDGGKPPQPIVSGAFMTDADYPADALARKEQGMVAISLTVDARGKVSGCRETQSSGSTSLDEATCALMTRRIRFKPARDASGNRVAGVSDTRFTWRIP